MENLTSDDLLIKSQLLISKFRKQREFSLQKQDKTLHTLHSCIPTKEVPLTSQNLLKRDLLGFHQYPQKYIENAMFNSFEKQFYHLNELKLNKPSSHNDKNYDNLSGSDNSLWSCSTESTHLKKTLIKKADRGVMTDFQEKLNIEDEEVCTPITALPPTIRSVEKFRNSLKETTPKIFSSICTNQNMSDSTTSYKNDTLSLTLPSKNPISNLAKASHLSFNENSVDDENIKMKTALELFEIENQMNMEIISKTQLLEKLNFELGELSKRIYVENDILNELKVRKDEIKNKRYEIFHGTTDEPELHINTCKNSPHINVSTNQSHSIVDCNAYKTHSDINSSSAVDKTDNSLYNLDNETVRNIVDKIIYKEFSNSEDNIFLKKDPSNQKDSINEEALIRNSERVEDFILSDVLSVKDLKISQSYVTDNFVSNKLSISPKKTKTYDCPPQAMKNKSRKVKSAHSVDNIACYSIASNGCVSRPSSRSRRKMRSPAISEELKRYLHYQSSSDSTS